MRNPLHTAAHTMMMAVHSNRIDVVKKHLPDVHCTWEPNQIFCYACQKGRLEIVQLLLPISDVNMDQGQPLCLATGQGHHDVVKYLLPHCDATLMRSEPLQVSILNGETELFELLYPHSDCVVALREVNKSIASFNVDNIQCLTLRDRLTDIVATQLQKKRLIGAVATVPTSEHPRGSRKI